MATALYRRYRPETFSEMIGQAHVTEPLMTALRTERIGHAYLFSGPRGCGKTTSARILARCLNCAEGPTDTPCGTCPSCVELSRGGGGSLDVVEIDAASHGGVDDARELRERAVFAPARDRYKIFIIDEAHMVTSGGFNALLKIVEEPPPHVKFIFATTEPEKVIGTIRSRTHHYPFRLIAPGALIDYVQQLCDSEGVTVEPGVLPLVVRAGGGSVRDTLSILDQLIAGSEGSSVALERANGLLGYTGSELIDGVVNAFAAADAAAAFAATDRVVQTGQDPRRFVEDLLERLRDLIVISATTVQGASAVFRGVADEQLQRMFEQSQAFDVAQLSRLADTVSTTLDRMTGATAPRLHLELMVARALRTREAASRAPQSQAPAPSVTATPAPASAPAAPTASPVPPAPAESGADAEAADLIATMKSARDFLKNDTAGASSPMVPLGGHRPAAPDRPASEPAPRPVEPGEPVGFAELVELWPELLDELLEGDRQAWNAVKAVQPLDLQGDVLHVGVASRSDLDAFKSFGSGPLREAIAAAVGISVKYLPKSIPAGEGSPAPPEQQAPAEPDPEPSPASEAPSAAEPPSAPEPPLDEIPEPPEPDDPGPDLGADPGLDPGPDTDPEKHGSEPQARQGGSDPDPRGGEATAPPTAKPGFTRYGEAVVREVLGARFLEERPLPTDLER